MIQYSLSVTATAGLFVAKKKIGQRLIVDARESNLSFSDSNAVDLASEVALGSIEVAG